jgi:hypothetical protein
MGRSLAVAGRGAARTGQCAEGMERENSDPRTEGVLQALDCMDSDSINENHHWSTILYLLDGSAHRVHHKARTRQHSMSPHPRQIAQSSESSPQDH